MKQGEIWMADLRPTKGREQSGQRPVVIISGNLLNTHLDVVIAIPLTTKIKNYKGNPILPANKNTRLKNESEMLVFHIRSISKNRLTERIGIIKKSDIDLAKKTLGDILKF